MKASGNIIKQHREKKGLSIKEVSDRTKIRPFIIEALEAGNFQIMSPIYVKSFLKTLSQFLEFPLSDMEDSNVETTTNTESNVKSNDKPKAQVKKQESKPTSVDIVNPEIEAEKAKYKKKTTKADKAKLAFDDENTALSKLKPKTETPDYAAMFKKANKPHISTTQIINYSAAGAIFIALILIIYFTFFDEGQKTESTAIIQDQIANDIDTTIISAEDKGLLNYFEEPDSLTLEAEATDDCWMRVEMDGERMEEITLKKGQTKTWKAFDYFSISQGNVGGVIFKRNGKLLEPFGSRGSVVRNVRVTKSDVQNANKEAQDSIRRRYKVIKRNSNKSNVPKLIQPSPINSDDPTKLLKKATESK